LLSYKINLRPEVRSRNIFTSSIFNQSGESSKPPVSTFIDTGASNTMLDIRLANKYGNKLDLTETIAIAGYRATAIGYVIPKILLDNKMTIQKVFVWGFPFEGGWLDGFLLLGLNTLNNWKYTVNKAEDELQIEENFPHDLLYKRTPYFNRFSKGKYAAV